MRVFITTSISDIFFLVSLSAILLYSKKIYGKLIFDLYYLRNQGFFEIISRDIPFFSLLLVLGPLGKSAQFPFYFWLLDAMVGPATVSALLHSSTMVKAGVYFAIRILDFFDVPGFFVYCLIFGLFSSFLSLFFSLFERKIKRILAYSTIANLGLIFIAVGIKRVDLALLHSVAHGFFKSSLFLLVPFLVSRDIFRTRFPKDLSKFIILIFFLSFIGVPPFLSYFTESSIIKEIWPESFLLSFLLHFYSMRFFMVLFSRPTTKIGKDGIMRSIIYIFAILNMLFIVIPILLGFKLHMDILIIPVAFLIAYILYWNKDRPYFEIILENYFRFRLLEKISMMISEISKKIRYMDRISPKYSSLVILLILLIGGALIWFLW